MNTLSRWFTHNPVAANLLMILILAGGVFSVYSLRIEGFPALPPTTVQITTLFPGASASEVDSSLSRRIEKAMEGLPGVKKISLWSEEGFSQVRIQKNSRTKIDRFQNEIQSRVDSLSGLPAGIEKPVVTRDEFNIEALLVQIYGDASADTLQTTARELQNRLQAHPRISKLSSFGLQQREIRIETTEEVLRAYGLTHSDISEAVQRESLLYKPGVLRGESGDLLLRTDKRALSPGDFSEISLLNVQGGSDIKIGDLAEVVRDYRDDGIFARFQGLPSVGFQVYTGREGHLPEVHDAAHQIVSEFRKTLPAGLRVDIWGDSSLYMTSRLRLLASNALQGLVIVFLLLALFLNVKLAFWVAMGIPISFAGTLALMGDRFLGYSLNDITTFGMIVVLGILVDDAIVVGESVFECRKEGGHQLEDTVRGVHRVSTATVFGCFTTVAAFFPLLLIDNDIGRIFASFSVVVIVSLLISLLESKMILPAHLAAVNLSERSEKRLWGRLQNRAATLLDTINRRLYVPALEVVLRYRYAALILFLVMAFCVLSLVGNGWIRTAFFPEVPGQIITVTLKNRVGTPETLLEKNIALIEEAARKTDAEGDIVYLMTVVTDRRSALIFAELRPEKERTGQTLDILGRWREAAGSPEGVETLEFSGSFETGGGFALTLSGPRQSSIRGASDLLLKKMADLEGVEGVRQAMRPGTPQLNISLKPGARNLGISAYDLAAQVGDAFGGIEIQKIRQGSEEQKVIVQLKKTERRGKRDLLNTGIRTAEGSIVPLGMAARIEPGLAPAAVERKNGDLVNYIEADLDSAVISSSVLFEVVKNDIFPAVEELYPDVDLKGAGDIEEMDGMNGGLKRALILIVFLIYVLLAIPLKSYGQPLVIMSVIPFGFTGAVIGHFVMGFPLSVLSFFGMLAVMGVVVNDSLVMLTRFNELCGEDMPFNEALVQSGSSRFRAILLTTITTVSGLLPLLTETSEQAQYLIPAAISLAWGEILATPVTLFIVPLLIAIAHDFPGRRKRRRPLSRVVA